jgi:hypothetical protein
MKSFLNTLTTVYDEPLVMSPQAHYAYLNTAFPGVFHSLSRGPRVQRHRYAKRVVPATAFPFLIVNKYDRLSLLDSQ